jgi:hypothetical protein
VRRIYLASAFSRNPEMRDIRDRLEALGHKVVSTWHDIQDGDAKEALFDEQLQNDPGHCAGFAITDLYQIEAMADTVVSFTGGGGRGGRHVEHGYAMGLGKDTIIVGPREHVFHCLMRQYDTTDEFLAAMKEGPCS